MPKVQIVMKVISSCGQVVWEIQHLRHFSSCFQRPVLRTSQVMLNNVQGLMTSVPQIISRLRRFNNRPPHPRVIGHKYDKSHCKCELTAKQEATEEKIFHLFIFIERMMSDLRNIGRSTEFIGFWNYNKSANQHSRPMSRPGTIPCQTWTAFLFVYFDLLTSLESILCWARSFGVLRVAKHQKLSCNLATHT